MKHAIATATTILLAASAVWAQPAKEVPKPRPEPDVAGLEELFEAHEAAFKSGDAKAIAALFSADADVVDPLGKVHTGPKAIAKMFLDEGEFSFSEPAVRFIRPTVAILDATWEIKAGDETAKGLVTGVAVKMGRKWKLVCARAMMPPPTQ